MADIDHIELIKFKIIFKNYFKLFRLDPNNDNKENQQFVKKKIQCQFFIFKRLIFFQTKTLIFFICHSHLKLFVLKLMNYLIQCPNCFINNIMNHPLS